MGEGTPAPPRGIFHRRFDPMARRRPSSNAITDRLEAFLATQQRIVGDFERSLGNARHFIDLAGVSLEQEPASTGTLLEQVMEIDLLRHVTEQFENFRSVAALLSAAQGPLETDAGALQPVLKRYEALVQEAEIQAERIATLLTTLRVTH
jgi:hypothetical protein